MTSVSFSVLGPKLLGHATDIIFSGVIGRRLPAGTSTAQAAADARAAGDDNFADLIARMHVVPGTGIDFTALAHVLALVVVLYAIASVFGWLQGYLLNDAVQRTVFAHALRRRGQAQPPAAAVLRRPATR